MNKINIIKYQAWDQISSQIYKNQYSIHFNKADQIYIQVWDQVTQKIKLPNKTEILSILNLHARKFKESMSED